MIARPNLTKQLLRLRDFQRDTVEYVFHRMYGESGATRFLVADEVGLGKTFVARGLIAKIVDHLWDKVNRIDIIYICSNSSIARQNISRLNITDVNDVALPSRITLLPTVVHDLERNRLNLVSLTPQTSLDLRSSLGLAEERALLYWLLPEEWKSSSTATRNALQGSADRERFRERVNSFNRDGIDETLRQKYLERLRTNNDLACEFQALCGRFAISRQNIPDDDRELQRKVIGALRMELARSCLGALEPDLIILDEFQRFKNLLDGTDPAAELARDLFGFDGARVLLMSATPYKMFTTNDEVNGDDHYRDFLQTVQFLYNDEAASAKFKSVLSEYQEELLRLSGDDNGALRARKNALQDALRHVMVRTERLAVTQDRNGMLAEVAPKSLWLRVNDLQSYVALARVAKALDHHDVVGYWKSTPYILNFMDDYKLKRDFESRVIENSSDSKLIEALGNLPDLMLSWDDIERYAEVDPANARLRALLSDTVGAGMWRLLWLPPSLPYYELKGPFGPHNAADLTKRLVFSSWQVVPKVVASLLSYEAERLMFEGVAASEERPNSQEARDKRRPLLRFARSDGRLTGLPLFALFYPAVTLAEIGDPLSYLRNSHSDERATSIEILQWVTEKISGLLELLPASDQSGPTDERWYWAAPILLDLHFHTESTRQWFAQAHLASIWSGELNEAETEALAGADEEVVDGSEAWRDHVAEAQKLVAGRISLGARPTDLSQILALVALGAPAIVALRALSRISGGEKSFGRLALRSDAALVGWSFRTLFNLPEVTAMIRAINAEEPYWLRVVEYCVSGCLQSVMDEFVHFLLEAEGVAYWPAGEAVHKIADRIRRALQLRTAILAIDAINVDPDAKKINTSQKRMRTRFAARYGAKQSDDTASGIRQDDVRAAFNSPFWPFVLCSTFVGQEGLDFHPYCHAVVHWNLPSNPVDLEQREGRVHRYKGHAVRKNIARLHKLSAKADKHDDPWASMFHAAVAARETTASDLVPFWVLTAENGAKIERHVLALPLSRDANRADMLRRALAVYRMAFGQARQEDLIEYLQQRISKEAIPAVAAELRIDLSPPKSPMIAASLDEIEGVEWRSEEIADEDGWIRPERSGDYVLSLDIAVDLLNEYSARAAANEQANPVERYRDLLDAVLRCRSAEA
jgi:Helicase conserved C-terminal domain